MRYIQVDNRLDLDDLDLNGLNDLDPVMVTDYLNIFFLYIYKKKKTFRGRLDWRKL